MSNCNGSMTNDTEFENDLLYLNTNQLDISSTEIYKFQKIIETLTKCQKVPHIYSQTPVKEHVRGSMNKCVLTCLLQS